MGSYGTVDSPINLALRPQGRATWSALVQTILECVGGEPKGTLDHQAAMAEMLPWLEAKEARLIVDHLPPMAEVAKAHVHLANRGTEGKAILLP